MEQWWLIGSSGGSEGAVVAHREQRWLLGSSGGPFGATPDCKLQSWVQIQQSPQPTVDCQSLDGQPSEMALCCMLSSEGWQRRIYLKKHQKQLRKKSIALQHKNAAWTCSKDMDGHAVWTCIMDMRHGHKPICIIDMEHRHAAHSAFSHM
jgi:hypothetical protein